VHMKRHARSNRHMRSKCHKRTHVMCAHTSCALKRHHKQSSVKQLRVAAGDAFMARSFVGGELPGRGDEMDAVCVMCGVWCVVCGVMCEVWQ